MRSRTVFALAAILAGIVLLGAPESARAAFIKLYLQEDGGTITEVASSTGSDVSFSGTFGNFTVSIFGGHRDDGASMSDILESTTSVKNTSGEKHKLSLWLSADDFSLPAGSPLNVESGLGGSVNAGTLTLKDIFQAYADSGNALLGKSFTNNPQSATASGSSFDTGSAFGQFSRSGNYSLTSVAHFELSGGGQANFSAHVNVTAVPAPAGVVLAVTALPWLGVFGLVRRRKSKVAGVVAS